MKVNFIFKTNTFNIEVKEDISISSLKNSISKMIQKDKSSFDLIYNNKILPENNSSLSQIVNNKTYILIIISQKNNGNNPRRKSNSLEHKIKLPFLTLPNKTSSVNNDNDINNLYSIESIRGKYYSSKDLNFIKGIDCLKKMKYITVNKVFEDIYNKKEENIIELMDILKKKILEYDDILYKKYKNRIDNDNKELLLYEKSIINFKDKQIKFLKNLINYFETKDPSSFSLDKINLEDCYQEFINTKTFIRKYPLKNEKKFNFDNKNNTIDKRLKRSSEEKLPTIPNIKSKEDYSFESSKSSEDSFKNNDNEVEEKSDKFLINKKLQINEAINSEKIQKKKNKNKLKLKMDNTIDKENSKTEKIDESQEPYQKQSSKTVDLANRNIKPYFSQKNINTLFEISENKHEYTELHSDMDSDSDNVYNIKEKKKEIIERNLKNTKNNLNFIHRNSIIGYKTKLRDRKKTYRLKKLGDNYSDFII